MFRNSWHRRSFPADSALAGQQLVIMSADVQDRNIFFSAHGMFPGTPPKSLSLEWTLEGLGVKPEEVVRTSPAPDPEPGAETLCLLRSSGD